MTVIEHEGRSAGADQNETGSRARFVLRPAADTDLSQHRQSTVNIFDAASNRMLHEVKVGKAPGSDDLQRHVCFHQIARD